MGSCDFASRPVKGTWLAFAGAQVTSKDAARWEAMYLDGHGASWPWDAVVAFLHRIGPRMSLSSVEQSPPRLLEVGCGTGANLLAAIDRGYSCVGIDFSPSALLAAKETFDISNRATFAVGEAERIPFQDRSFDVVIDRAALTHQPPAALKASLREVARVLRPGGYFFFSPFSTHCAAASYALTRWGALWTGDQFPSGQFQGVGTVTFLSVDHIDEVLPPTQWHIASATQVDSSPLISTRDFPENERISEIRVIAQRIRN